MKELLSLLAAGYGVSIEAMMSRLRSLQLWESELYFWRYDAGVGFVLDRIIGSRFLPWKWWDAAVPMRAWQNGRHSGHSDLEYRVDQESKHFKSISFDAKREGTTLVVLSRATTAELPPPLWQVIGNKAVNPNEPEA